MTSTILRLLCLIPIARRLSSELALENLALRQQLAVLSRQHRRPKLRRSDLCGARPAAFVLFGTFAGLSVFYTGAPLLEKLLYGISARDPVILPIAAATLLLLAGPVTGITAATALFIDPARALRDE
jgi:hypothetical protein